MSYVCIPLHAHHELSIGYQVLDLYEQFAWSANTPKLAPAGFFYIISREKMRSAQRQTG
jgi:hypothetical protein